MHVFCHVASGIVIHVAAPRDAKGVMTGDAKSFDLRPGVNDVPDDLWKQWSAENVEYGPLKSGLIFVHSTPAAPPPASSEPKSASPAAQEKPEAEKDD